MDMPARQTLRIEVIVDTICPWCFIGKRRLERALAAEGLYDPPILWRPFLLNPDMSPSGVERQRYLTDKFGGRAAAQRVYDVIRLTGAEMGIAFDFGAIRITPASVDSHRLIRFCLERAPHRANELVENIFSAFFCEGRDIGDPAVLNDLGEDIGLPAAALRTHLRSDRDRAVIESENLRAHRVGVTGVPCYVFNGRYALSGAQEVEILSRMIRLARLEAGLG